MPANETLPDLVGDIHELLLAGYCSQRKVIGYRFSECRNIGCDTVIFSGATRSETETADDFIEKLGSVSLSVPS